MKLYLDTSAPEVILRLDNQEYRWQAGRKLARNLLQFIHDKLTDNHADWQNLSELHFFAGPGSFTGLRIGATIINTLADQLKIPLYNQRGERLLLIVPEYGAPAHITPPRK